MATYSNWCGKLKECGVFDVLRRGSDKVNPANEAKNLIIEKDGILLVWNSNDATLLRVKLKQLATTSKRPTYQVNKP